MTNIVQVDSKQSTSNNNYNNHLLDHSKYKPYNYSLGFWILDCEYCKENFMSYSFGAGYLVPDDKGEYVSNLL
jgi:hypothetical protein